VATVFLAIAIAELPEEGRLHGRHDVLGAHAVLEIRRADGTVLDAVAQPLAGILALSPGHSVQCLLDGAVAGGVHRVLKALPVHTTEEIGGGKRL
jgi:hypothetical protein